jgi:predicted aspartyl protease
MTTPSLPRTRTHRLPRKFLGLLLVILIYAGQPSPAQQKAGGLKEYLKKLGCESVPLRRTAGDAPLADGHVAGKKCVFLIDTGWCRMTTLDPTIGRQFKSLSELGVTLEDSFLGPLTNSSIVVIDKLALGRAQFLNQPARVDRIELEYVSVPFDGALGYDFYLRNYCLIDCTECRLYVRGHPPTADQSRALSESLEQSGFIGLKMATVRGFTVEARVNNQTVRLLVDTGASLSMLDETRAKSIGLQPVRHVPTGSFIPENVNVGMIGFGAIGRHQMWVTTLKQLDVGARTWKNIYFEVENLKPWRIEAFGTGPNTVHGLFGADMLTTSHALIDLGTGMLWFAAVKSQSR